MIEQITRLPRVILGHWPTPLVDAKCLSEILGGPRILIKREDLTGLALGGNKCRRLEFLFGALRQKGVDSILLCGISNTSVQLASAAAKTGIKVRQVLLRDATTPRERQGNYLLHKILNTDMRVREPISPIQTLDDEIAMSNSAVESEVLKLREEGYNPFVMRPLESTPVEQVGWVNAVEEIWQQLKAQNVEARYVIVGDSSGGTHSGLALGAKYLGAPFKVIGISTSLKGDRVVSKICRMANGTAELLKLGISITPEDITVYDEYMGEGHGKITRECVEAIKLVAQTEGFFLDPVYTGKAMAGLIDLIHKGQFTSKDTVVFIHTGGIPALFAYNEELSQ